MFGPADYSTGSGVIPVGPGTPRAIQYEREDLSPYPERTLGRTMALRALVDEEDMGVNAEEARHGARMPCDNHSRRGGTRRLRHEHTIGLGNNDHLVHVDLSTHLDLYGSPGSPVRLWPACRDLYLWSCGHRPCVRRSSL